MKQQQVTSLQVLIGAQTEKHAEWSLSEIE